MAEKKSFLLYFDMYPSICNLPPEQRGYLFSALFEYADAAWKEGVGKEVIQKRFPQLSEAASMAYSFIAEAIQRDTDKWREKQARYQQAAVARSEKVRQESDIGKYIKALRGDSGEVDDAWKYV